DRVHAAAQVGCVAVNVAPISACAVCEAVCSKTALFSGHFEGVLHGRVSYSSSRSAATKTAFFVQDMFAMSLRRPPDRVDRHMPGHWVSRTTRPNLRRPASRTHSFPSRFQVRGLEWSCLILLWRCCVCCVGWRAG